MAESRLAGGGRPYKTNLFWFRAADSFLRNVVKIPDLVAQNCDIDSEDSDRPHPESQRDVIIEFLHPVDDMQTEKTVKASGSARDSEFPDDGQPPLAPGPEKRASLPFAKKRKMSSDSEKVEDSSFSSWVETRDHCEEDEFDVFGRYIALQMKQLPPEAALELQVEIQNAVVQKRLEALRKSPDKRTTESSSKPSDAPVTATDTREEIVAPTEDTLVGQRESSREATEP